MSKLAVALTAKQADGTATVDMLGKAVTVYVSRDQAVAAGDALLIDDSNSTPFVVGRYGTGTVAAQLSPLENPPDPQPAVTAESFIVPAFQTISYKGSAWRTDNDFMYQGNLNSTGNHIGVAFYADRFAGLAGSVCTEILVNLKRRGAGGSATAQALTMALITEAAKPGGAPTVQATTAGPSLRWNDSATFALPTSWGQALIDGTAGGIGLYASTGSPYLIMEGRSGYSSAFTLTVSYERTN